MSARTRGEKREAREWRRRGRTVAVDVGLTDHALDLVVGDGVDSERAHHRLQFGRLDPPVFVAVQHPERAADLCNATQQSLSRYMPASAWLMTRAKNTPSIKSQPGVGCSEEPILLFTIYKQIIYIK